MAVAYVRKQGRTSSPGRTLAVAMNSSSGRSPMAAQCRPSCSSRPTTDQRFFLTNPPGYFMRYNGLVAAIEKAAHPCLAGVRVLHVLEVRRAASVKRRNGSGPAVEYRSAANGPFGRDPNDLTNASGSLPNHRPHALRAMASVGVPKTGLVLAGNFQHFSGKPWAAATLRGSSTEQPAARPARATRFATSAVAIAARPAAFTGVSVRRDGPRRIPARCAQRAQRYG